MPVNPKYEGKELIILQALANHPTVPNVKLSSFYDQATHKKIHTFLRSIKWKKAVAPLEYAYETAVVPKNIQALLQNEIFNAVTKKKPTFTAVRLTHKSYSMLHDKVKPKNWTFILDFTPQFNEKAGGEIVFVGSETIQIPASDNTAYLVLSKKAPMFYQYVNHYGGERVFLLAQLS